MTLCAMVFAAAASFAQPGGAEGGSSSTAAWRAAKRCGVNCLYVVLRMRGVEVAYEKLVAQTPISDNGSTLADLAKSAAGFDVKFTPVKAQASSIPRWPLPAVIHLERPNLDNHYVVLLRCSGETCRVLDCSTGAVSDWSAAELRDKWTGYALLSEAPGWDLLALRWLVNAWIVVGAMFLGLALWRRFGSGRRALETAGARSVAATSPVE